MLSDEEKKAVKLLNDMIKNKPDTIRLEWRKGIYALQIILNLIEKQQKEIEELKRDEETFIHLGECIGEKKVEDKIKARIEELEKLDFGTDLVSQFTANLTTITILQSLLEKE